MERAMLLIRCRDKRGSENGSRHKITEMTKCQGQEEKITDGVKGALIGMHWRANMVGKDHIEDQETRCVCL